MLTKEVRRLIDFVEMNTFDESVLKDFYDFYLPSGSNDILINLEDLKFIHDGFITDSTYIVSKNNILNSFIDTMKELIIEDKEKHLLNADVIFVLFKINPDTPIMKINNAMDL